MIARVLLGPLLLWQGRQVRATALRLPEAAGPRAQPGGTLRVSHTLPPMDEPRPMVMRPRMVAPA